MAKGRHGTASGRWERWRGLVAAAALVGAVAAVFLPAVWFDFTNYDELEQVLENPLAHSLSLGNIAKMFRSFCISSYYPVRLLSFAVDYRLGGRSATGFHVTNLLIHAANVVLVFRLAVRLLRGAPLLDPSLLTGEGGVRVRDARKGCPEVGSTLSVTPLPLPLSSSSLSLRAEGRQGRGVFAAAVGAAIFALHPVVVEPVAWVAGREELLMVFFALVSVHLFLGKRLLTPLPLLAGAVLAGACSAMSNIVGAVLPFMLTALCLTLPRPEAAAGVRRWRGVAGGLLRTVPFWLIAVGALVAKEIGEKVTSGVVRSSLMPVLSLPERASAVLRVYALNLRTLFWPRELIPTYATVRYEAAVDWLLLAGAVLVAGTLVLLWVVRRRRVVLLGLVWFLLGLAPSSQVIPHHIARADRFLYLPLVGVAVALAAAGHRLVRAGGRPRAAWLLAPGLAAAAVLGVASRLQLPYWRDSIAIFGRCVELAPEVRSARNNLGAGLTAAGRPEEAIPHFEAALRLKAADHEVLSNLGAALADMGRWREAVARHEEAIRLRPDYAQARYNLGVALARNGRLSEAVGQYREALRLMSDYPAAHSNLAGLLNDLGRVEEAIGHYREALRLKPDFAEAHNNLGSVLSDAGRREEGMRHYRQALRLRPDFAEAHCNLGAALAGLGRWGEAIAGYQTALRLKPDLARAHVNLGLALIAAGRWREAAGHMEQALLLQGESAEVCNNLARLLATHEPASGQDAARAVALARRADELSGGGSAVVADTLAAALASAGRFPEAIETARKAVELAAAAGQDGLVRDIEARLELYRAGRPYRQGPPR